MGAHHLVCIYGMLLVAVGVHTRRPPAPLTARQMVSKLTRANWMIRAVKENLKRTALKHRNIDTRETVITVVKPLPEPQYPGDFNETCKLPIDQGCSCAGRRRRRSDKGTPGIRYAYAASSGGCRAFRYRGCGGNGNKFDSHDRCHHCCHDGCDDDEMMDRGPRCGFMVKSLSAKGEWCKGKGGKSACPATHECHNGIWGWDSICCPKDTEAVLQASISSKCADGSAAVALPMGPGYGDWNRTLLGARCEHDFCPGGTRCEQRQAAAACCQRTIG